MEVQWPKERIYLIIADTFYVNRPTNQSSVSTLNICDRKKTIFSIYSQNLPRKTALVAPISLIYHSQIHKLSVDMSYILN